MRVQKYGSVTLSHLKATTSATSSHFKTATVFLNTIFSVISVLSGLHQLMDHSPFQLFLLRWNYCPCFISCLQIVNQRTLKHLVSQFSSVNNLKRSDQWTKCRPSNFKYKWTECYVTVATAKVRQQLVRVLHYQYHTDRAVGQGAGPPPKIMSWAPYNTNTGMQYPFSRIQGGQTYSK